jgi:hypothetical protein
MEMSTQFDLMRLLRMNGALPPRRNVPSCNEQGPLYIFVRVLQ